MVQGEFEQLFTTSLTGLYRDNILEEGFKEFTNMILNPHFAQNRERHDAEIAGQELPEQPLMEPLPEPMDITMPEVPYAGPPSVAPSISSSVPSSDLFAGYRIDQIVVPSSISPKEGIVVLLCCVYWL